MGIGYGGMKTVGIVARPQNMVTTDNRLRGNMPMRVREGAYRVDEPLDANVPGITLPSLPRLWATGTCLCSSGVGAGC